jgi:hypothetical protein
MKADKTDKLIVSTIAALPYRSPSADFSARVMAEMAVEPQPCDMLVLKVADLIVIGWTAVLAYVSVGFVYSNLADLAALLIQPGGVAQAFNLLAAHAALVLTKLVAVVSPASEVLLAVAGLPPWYEITAAALICAAVVTALSKNGRLARQEI